MTTPLFLLRCMEAGISIQNLELLTIGLVLDMCTEKANNSVKYRRIVDQSDFDKFLVFKNNYEIFCVEEDRIVL